MIILSFVFFYVLGHANRISDIHYAEAFFGWPNTVIMQVIMTVLNTNGSFFLGIVALWHLNLWSFSYIQIFFAWVTLLVAHIILTRRFELFEEWSWTFRELEFYPLQLYSLCIFVIPIELVFPLQQLPKTKEEQEGYAVPRTSEEEI